jgi:glutaredoxin
MKKIMVGIVLFFSQFILTLAQDEIIEFSVFTRSNCVHCIELKEFINSHPESFTHAQPKYYDIEDSENEIIFNTFTNKNNLTKATPIILI